MGNLDNIPQMSPHTSAKVAKLREMCPNVTDEVALNVLAASNGSVSDAALQLSDPRMQAMLKTAEVNKKKQEQQEQKKLKQQQAAKQAHEASQQAKASMYSSPS